MEKIGSRAKVMHGTAEKTSGGLTQIDLKYNNYGKIVSKKASSSAKRVNNLGKAGYTTQKGYFGSILKGGVTKKTNTNNKTANTNNKTANTNNKPTNTNNKPTNTNNKPTNTNNKPVNIKKEQTNENKEKKIKISQKRIEIIDEISKNKNMTSDVQKLFDELSKMEMENKQDSKTYKTKLEKFLERTGMSHIDWIKCINFQRKRLESIRRKKSKNKKNWNNYIII